MIEVTAAMVRPPAGAFLVVWVDGAPMACGALRPLDDTSGTGEIKRMYTRPAGRRQGLSRLLLERLEAVSLYDSADWLRIAPYGRYKDSGQSVCFAKELGPA